MGKKSKAKAAPSLRCVKCKIFLKSIDKGVECPGCDGIFCDPCAYSGRKGEVPFMGCHNKDCTSPLRCFDCTFGTTLRKMGEKNKKRRERGEPHVKEKRHWADRQGCLDIMSMCGNCHELVCFECSNFQTKELLGHYQCMEKGCHKIRCFKCCVESGDPKHFVMYCFGCEWTRCSECDPNMTWDSTSGNDYCGKCSSDESIVGNNILLPATDLSNWMSKNKDKKICELDEGVQQKVVHRKEIQQKIAAGMPKYQYYQDDNFMKIQILEPMVQRENLDVTFSPDELTVKVKKQEASKGLVEYTVIYGGFYGEVDVDKCKYVIKDEKVLIKLKKKDNVHWGELLDDKRSRDRQKRREGGAVGNTANVNDDGNLFNESNRNQMASTTHPLPQPTDGGTSGCVHVADHPGHYHQPFTDVYFQEVIKETSKAKHSNKMTLYVDVAIKAIKTTMKYHPNSWMGHTKQIIDYFVMSGVDQLLWHNDFVNAEMFATVIVTLEKEMKGQDLLKYRDAIRGCSRSLFKVYIDRMTCTCLEEKYKQLKATQPKTGLCDHCETRTERSKLFSCSQCNKVQYCSRECQIADTTHGCLHKKSSK